MIKKLRARRAIKKMMKMRPVDDGSPCVYNMIDISYPDDARNSFMYVSGDPLVNLTLTVVTGPHSSHVLHSQSMHLSEVPPSILRTGYGSS